MNDIHVNIITHLGNEAEFDCDSIHLNIPDDSKGQGKGSLGIRKGHMNCLIALAPGKIEAISNNASIFTKEILGGFAVLNDDNLTIVEKTGEEA